MIYRLLLAIAFDVFMLYMTLYNMVTEPSWILFWCLIPLLFGWVHLLERDLDRLLVPTETS